MTTYSFHSPHRSRVSRWAARLLLPLLVTAAGCGSAGSEAPAVGNPQMAFGVQMAQQGLWSEALFRFQQAVRANPSDYRVVNNLAVAYEATGQYDEALETYQRALELAPDNRELRRNYARFAEFYQSFRSQPTQAREGGEGDAGSAPTAD
jgi:type IV pilus assembly protein PilF